MSIFKVYIVQSVSTINAYVSPQKSFMTFAVQKWNLAMFCQQTVQKLIRLCPAMQKHVFENMQTTKPKISLHIYAVWSGLSLSAIRIICYYRIHERRPKAQVILLVYAGSVFVHFAHVVQRHFFAWLGPDWFLNIALDKEGIQNNFLISPQKHILWVLVRNTTVTKT